MESSDLVRAGLVEIAGLIRAGAVSATEVTQMTLARIDEIDDTYMSYVHLCRENALASAAKADDDIAQGIHRGPLHGVPLGIKDLCYTSFAPTALGTAIHSEFTPDYDATVVSRLISAGSVILGKLTMTEGAYTSHHPEIPAPPNPWGHDLWVGSSSTGSAVATSAGLCFGSLGSDTGGSIRFPCATCGLTGIKPTWGRVSRYGAFALAETLDHIGPMARSAEDCAAILQVIAGWDPNDPTSIDSPVHNYMAEVGGSIRDMRIGFDRDYAFSDVDAEVVKALEAAVEVFKELGVRIVDVQFPHYKELVSNWIMMCAVETAVAHQEAYPARAGEYGPELSQLIDEGRRTSGMQVAYATQLRRAFTESLVTMMGNVDCMLIPTMPLQIPRLAEMSAYGADPSVLNGILRFTAPFNFSGHPTITLPNGIDSRGLPLSMQLVGPRLREDVLVRAGHAYQTMTDWHRKTPKALAAD